jgi:hypothetical protein
MTVLLASVGGLDGVYRPGVGGDAVGWFSCDEVAHMRDDLGQELARRLALSGYEVQVASRWSTPIARGNRRWYSMDDLRRIVNGNAVITSDDRPSRRQ